MILMSRGHRRDAVLIPAGPFMLWLQARIDRCSHRDGDKGACVRVAFELGWDGESGQRKLHRYRYGIGERTKHAKGVRLSYETYQRDSFKRHEVEAALQHAGFQLSDVYPVEQYPAVHTDIDPEPAAWCPHCAREQQPVLGHCITCDWRISDEGSRDVAA